MGFLMTRFSSPSLDLGKVTRSTVAGPADFFVFNFDWSAILNFSLEHLAKVSIS